MTLENQNMSERKLMTFQWDGNSYGIMLEKLKSAQTNTVSQKKIHPFFREFRIPRNTNCIKLNSGHYVPTQGMPKIEEVIIETNISLPYLIQDKVIGYFNLRKNHETFFGLLLDDI